MKTSWMLAGLEDIANQIREEEGSLRVDRGQVAMLKDAYRVSRDNLRRVDPDALYRFENRR